MAKKKSKKPRKKSKTVILVILLLMLLAIALLYIDSNTRLVTTEYTMYFSNLPAGFDKFRIVVLSDLHGVEHGRNNEKLIDAVKAADPDIIVINGDLIDRYQPGKPVERQLEIAQRLVGELVRVASVYYTTGNHEWDSGEVRTLLSMLKDSGVNVLQNQYQRLTRGGGSIIIAGVDDPNGPADMVTPQELIEKIHSQGREEFIAVIYHRNNKLTMFSELGVSLVLSGHAHGGMIRLPFTEGVFGPNNEFFPSYTSGVYETGDTRMVVSRGLGNHFGWTRFLNNPQIVVVELWA